METIVITYVPGQGIIVKKDSSSNYSIFESEGISPLTKLKMQWAISAPRSSGKLRVRLIIEVIVIIDFKNCYNCNH